MADLIQMRRDTAQNWAIANPVLGEGELGFETDTMRFKHGDGTNHWNSLPYFTDFDGAFNVSEYMDIEYPAHFAGLAAALGYVPNEVRTAGMRIKFILQEGENEAATDPYVQYRLKLSTFNSSQFSNVNNWQRVDSLVHLTQEAYDALSDEKKMNGDWYFIEE